MRQIFATLLVLCVTTVGWITIVRYLARPSIATEWIDGIYAKKEAAAAKIEGPKIVIIGGSGAHYGFSGEAITRATGIPTVNLGVHAGLGGEYLLDRAKRSLKAGDWAVMALEPQLTVATAPSDVLAAHVLRNDIFYLWHTPRLGDAFRILFGLTPVDVFATQLRRLVPWTAPTGRADTVSHWGDETLELSKSIAPWMRKHLQDAPPISAQHFDPDNPPPVLAPFFAWAKEHHVQVAQAWTPLLMRPEYLEEPYRSSFASLKKVFVKAGGIPLGSATDYFQPIDRMYDYILHANELGRARASEVLAREICKARACRPQIAAPPS
jgi:hypothetical protein